MKKYVPYVCIFFVIGTLFYFYNYKIDKVSIHQKCPDEYGTDATSSAQYLADFSKWTNFFYDAHPSATLTEWSAARYQFWVDNKCDAAIARYNEFKTATVKTEKMKVLETMVSEIVLENATQTPQK